MARSLVQRRFRKNIAAIRTAITIAGGPGGGLWHSNNADPSAAAAAAAAAAAQQEADAANLPDPPWMEARKNGRGRMLVPRIPEPWKRPKPAGYGFTVVSTNGFLSHLYI
jgi:hypothetical protein